MFGRGGEEAIALAEAGIPYRIIPGVTAGLAALSAASIPATMRGVNQAIIFATGHADARFRLGGAGAHRAADRDLHGDAQRRADRRRRWRAAGSPPRHAGRRDRRGDHAASSASSSPGSTGLPTTVRKLGFGLPGPDRDRRHRHGARPAAASWSRNSRPRGERTRPDRLGAALQLGQDHSSRSACSARCARKGVAVRAAKSGPDYIDPAFHAAATGAKGVNLDTWAMPPALIDALIADATQSADVLVIEGAMGLFDGVPGTPGRSGAASDLAARSRPAGAARSRRVGAVAIGGRGCRGLCLVSIRRCASAASCSTSSAATAIAR